jgi:DNA-directed RNA polymerase subunit L
MATFKVTKKSDYFLNSEFKNFPLTFVNALRRITLSEIPTVVLRDVQIHSNTSQMPYEMLKHRMELLPVNVSPEDTQIIKEATVELIAPSKVQPQVLTTDDFTVKNGRERILMRDRDLDTPLLFLRLKPNEEVHISGKLSVEPGSQVCTSAMSYHIDPERATNDRKSWIERGEDPRVFDNFYIQKSYSIDDIGRPNWIDLNIESIGVLKSSEILKYGVTILKKKIQDWMKASLDLIAKEEGGYNVKMDGGHTVGALLQEVFYHAGVQFVSYDIPHPMKPQMVLRFVSDRQPEGLFKEIKETIEEYCDIVEKAL